MTENSATSYQPNRRFRIKRNAWAPYVGECKAFEDYLGSKTGWGWTLPKFLSALLRGVGQVVFCNNPLTGLIILASLFWADPIVGLAATVAGSTAIVTAMIFRQETSAITSGLTTYNAILVGSVTAALWTPVYHAEISFLIWAFIILGSVLSVFVNTALTNLLGSFKAPLPSLTFSFNIVTLLLFTCLNPGPMAVAPTSNGTLEQEGVAMELVARPVDPALNNSILSRTVRELMPNGTDGTSIDVVPVEYMHWGSIMLGILLSMGQVYGVENLIASVLMYIATIFYSPCIFFMSVVGAILGTIFGILFTAAPYSAVYSGVWGFNGILSAAAIGGFFFVLSFHSFATALVNVLLTVMIQHALALAFGPTHLPVFTMPFVLSSFIFLQMSGIGLTRVGTITCPELHFHEHKRNKMMNRPEGNRRDTTDEIAEEKELVLKEVKVIMEDAPKDVEKEEKSEKTEENGESK